MKVMLLGLNKWRVTWVNSEKNDSESKKIYLVTPVFLTKKNLWRLVCLASKVSKKKAVAISTLDRGWKIQIGNLRVELWVE